MYIYITELEVFDLGQPFDNTLFVGVDSELRGLRWKREPNWSKNTL